jgi:hypothetical protein
MEKAKAIKELESLIIERVKFWDGYIDMLIRLRDSGLNSAEKVNAWRVNPSNRLLRDGLQQAIDAAYHLQREELAGCFMLAGIGGERAEEYARERAKAILGDDELLDFASKMEWVPTYWHRKDK